MSHYLLGKLEEFDADRAIDLTVAAQMIPSPRKRGRCIHREVLARWWRKGYSCDGWTGQRVPFPALKIGGNLMTMPSWVRAFQRAQAAMGERREPAPVHRSERAATSAHDRATESLRRRGMVA